MLTTLSPNIALDLFACFDRSLSLVSCEGGSHQRGITTAMLRRQFPSLMHGVQDWFLQAGLVDSWEVPCDDELVDVNLERHPDNCQLFRYRHPEHGGWLTLPEIDAAVWQLKADRLLHGLADSLSIPMQDRQGIENPVLPDLLWRLGTARLAEGFFYPVWCCRGLGLHRKALLDCLSGLRGGVTRA